MNFVRQPWVIILLIVLVILLFGANKLPGLARNMGQSMRIFKSEVQEMRKEDSKDATPEQSSLETRAHEPRREYDPVEDRERSSDELYRRD